MFPLTFFEGGRIFHWNRLIWAGMAIVSGFLMWHVLLGRERAYFSGLRQASSISVVALFLAYTALSLGLWAYFRFRRPAVTPAVPEA